MKPILLTVAISLAASPVLADTISPSHAMTDLGQNEIVEGTAHIQDGAGGGAAIELTGAGGGSLRIIIPERVKATLPDLSSYEGKIVDVAGSIESGDHGVQITVYHANQLKLAAP
jgi:hypothetical protein